MSLPRNPRRAGGPQTPVGRAAVATNALQSGVYSRQVLLQGESTADFEALLQQFHQDFAPADVAESAMVEQLAVLTWKKLRLNRMEAHALQSALEAPFSQYEVEPVLHRLPPGSDTDWFNLLHHVPSEELDALLQGCQRVKQLVARSAQVSVQALAALREQHPMVWKHVEEAMAQEGITPQSDEHLLQWQHASRGCSVNWLVACLNGFVSTWEWMQPLANPATRMAAEEALALLRDRRLLQCLDHRNLAQHHTDLDRQFQRALTELRRHQTWRRSMATVQVVQAPNALPPGAAGPVSGT